MSLPDRFKLMIAPAACAVLLALGGCTMAPVYGDPATPSSLSHTSITFEKADNRTEQIIFQDLAKSFDVSGAGRHYFARLDVSGRSASLGTSTVGSPFTTYRQTLTGTLSVYLNETDEAPLFTIMRQSSTLYEIADESGIADYESNISASEKAAHALAETLRLALFSELPDYF